MKYSFILALLIFTILNVNSQTAQFMFGEGEGTVLLKASIDQKSLQIALDKKMTCGEESMTSCADRYLSKNFMSIFNGDVMKMTLDSSKVEDDNVDLYYHINFDPSTLNEVWIKTGFMVEEYEGHVNAVTFNIKGQEQNMNMNAEKRVSQFYF